MNIFSGGCSPVNRFSFLAFSSFPFGKCVQRPSIFNTNVLQHSLSWGWGDINNFQTADHACVLLRFMNSTLNLKNKQPKYHRVAGIRMKNILFLKKSSRTVFLERDPMSFCQCKVLFHNSFCRRLKFDIHLRIYGQQGFAEREGYNIQIAGVIFKKGSRILIK